MNPETGEPPAEVYRRYLDSGALGVQRCTGCVAAVFYPRVLCPVCGGDDLSWETSSGRGSSTRRRPCRGGRANPTMSSSPISKRASG